MTDIFLSAGHYPGRPGVRYGRISEFDVVAQVTSAVYGRIFELDSDRYPGTFLVPTGPLKSKVKFINRNAEPRDLAVELHLNAWRGYQPNNPPGPEINPRGAETWIFQRADQATAAAAESIIAPLDKFWRRRRQYSVRRSAGLYFLRRTICPGIIIEIDFIHAAGYCLAEIGPLSTVLARGIVNAAEIIESAPIST